ncbi:D-alanyl-D-alanine carboxypeptidase/D-alanyl-D-alanine-endopeptidase [Microterricola viridarii]|uniref:D-alanyl-D-alanine carboxypeptidase / D-alanyl-D-alanine-endopeptidase (Penicillin-binding protein 4) n=1 Tax=Microterricola viridarii TaxID=412690 RepID=A0A1H1YXP3_9MICO|nr:D-alanyl-D-alanine carboxypeptidase [Microterricola viridarii]SDT26210.1 D-alanyl-D-alanine carboxypeptidase / D-alanyl-D-alanine-endopeptidase (penicillin-binding protein 4) [Microterricola viridarii]
MPDSDQPRPAPSPAQGSGATRERGGFLGTLRKHPRATLITAGALALVLFGGIAVAAGSAFGAPATASVALATPSNTPTPTPTQTSRPAPAAEPAASIVRLCSVADLASDPRLGSFQAQVRNAATGEVLYDRGGDTASRAASVMKVLTSAAALDVLGPDYRATTTVVAGAEPGSVVLVGGGDITLSRTPSGDESAYAGAAHLDELAAQVRAAWDANPANPPLTKLVLDSSLFGGAEWQPSWDSKELWDGYMPPITALQVDGDRDNAYSNTSSRSEDPIGRAGEAFADELGGVSVERGTAPAGAAVLGSVQSQPVSTLIQQTLIVSDNAIAEMLARLVAVESGAGNSFEAIQAGTLAGLAGYGIDTTGIVAVDGSGLSDDNAIPPSYLTQLFMKINAREGNLGVIFDGLPVAGQSGSLSYSDRFGGDSAIADGSVFAKTGWIDTGYTLSGVIHAADGTPLTFAIYALDDVGDSAKTAIDALTAGFYSCGNTLSNL